jgi:hypothetical protein
MIQKEGSQNYKNEGEQEHVLNLEMRMMKKDRFKKVEVHYD